MKMKRMNSYQQRSQQKILKQKSWQGMHNGFKTMNYLIQLLQSKPNAKHEKRTLSIQIIWQSEQIVYTKQYKTSDLPSQAITIFSDVQTLYDYIEQNYNDNSRIRFIPEDGSFVIVNIVVMKNKQLKQQITFLLNQQQYIRVKQQDVQLQTVQLNRQISNSSDRLNSSRISSKQIIQQSKLIIQSMIKDKSQQLQNKVNYLNQTVSQLVSQIKSLKNQNNTLVNALNSCSINVAKLQRQSILINQKLILLEKQNSHLSNIIHQQQSNSSCKINPQQLSQNYQHIKNQLSTHKWHIDQLDNSFINIQQSHAQLLKFKQKSEENIKSQPKNDYVLPLVNQMKKQIYHLNTKIIQIKQNSSRLGNKMFINLDIKNNKYIDNFRIIENIVEKVQGDQQRHQLLGNQAFNIFDLKSKIYFEIKIISTINAQVVIGIVAETRRGQRYSYDKKQCVCYDGQGFIFQQGHKIKMPCQFHPGQTIRIVLDPFEALIDWFVGYTQVGSTFIPQSMRKMKILPYFELYCISDKVAING